MAFMQMRIKVPSDRIPGLQNKLTDVRPPPIEDNYNVLNYLVADGNCVIQVPRKSGKEATTEITICYMPTWWDKIRYAVNYGYKWPTNVPRQVKQLFEGINTDIGRVYHTRA